MVYASSGKRTNLQFCVLTQPSRRKAYNLSTLAHSKKLFVSIPDLVSKRNSSLSGSSSKKLAFDLDNKRLCIHWFLHHSTSPVRLREANCKTSISSKKPGITMICGTSRKIEESHNMFRCIKGTKRSVKLSGRNYILKPLINGRVL